MSDKQPYNDRSCITYAGKTTEELIEMMKEEDQAAKRTRIVEKMTPACREKLDFFEHWIRRQCDHMLRSRYELGKAALELLEDEQKNGGKLYGKNAIGRICKVLQWDDGLIRLSMRFARNYSEADLERLCALVMPSGETLTWSHLRCLLTISEAKQRQDLLDLAVRESWSCTELAHQVKYLDEDKEPDSRGRPPTKPKDFDSAVKQQLEHAGQWDRRHSRVWGQQDTSLVAQATKLAPEEVTKERLQKAQELAYQLRCVANQAIKQAEAAEQVAREFEQILKKQEEVTAGDNGLAEAATILEFQNSEQLTVGPPAVTSRQERNHSRS